jgi:GMP synthase (glutamine-hydrolysing)
MIALIDCGSSKTPQIAEQLEAYIDVDVISMLDLKQENCTNFAGFVISGAPILLTELDPTPYLKQFAWFRTENRPILGICFGHQILGLLNGARIAKMKEDRVFQEIEVIHADPLFLRLPDVFDMQEDHCEHISIPKNFEHLACSDTCINEAMKHKTKMHYGVQFHPEVSGNYGNILLENFVNVVLEVKV